MSYNWDLMERLLHEVQNSACKGFAPRLHAEELAAEQANAGQPITNLDGLRREAADYEALLLRSGFIEPRPERQGGNGENFILTSRGLRLLSLIDGGFPGNSTAREHLDQQGQAALVPEVFDELAVRASRDPAIAG
jgi:hypothetical protein